LLRTKCRHCHRSSTPSPTGYGWLCEILVSVSFVSSLSFFFC
jgi:hypothetical protein